MPEYKEPNAAQIRVALDEIDHQVWRQLIVPLSHILRQLHLIIQAAFGWQESHLHEFRIGGLGYGDADVLNAEAFVGDPVHFEQMDVSLKDFSREPGITFQYVYDFGDHWVHTVTLETRTLAEPLPKIATCIAGARACPPEDDGGISGYEDFLLALADPVCEDHEHVKRWCGGHFDPDWFDRDLANKNLAAAFRPSRRRRLRQPKPKPAATENSKG